MIAISKEERERMVVGARKVLDALNSSPKGEPLRRAHASSGPSDKEKETMRRGAAMVLSALEQTTLPGYITTRPSAQN